jgi:hypothetical protein
MKLTTMICIKHNPKSVYIKNPVAGYVNWAIIDKIHIPVANGTLNCLNTLRYCALNQNEIR